MKYYKFDTQNNLVTLSNSLLKHFGVTPFHSEIKEVEDYLGDSKKVILMLFDGMGKSIIDYHLKDNDYLKTHILKKIDSVFPPTTVAATDALLSAKYPVENGWLGWTTYSHELNKVITSFMGTDYETQEMIDPQYMQKHVAYDNITKLIGDKNPGLYSDSHWPAWKHHKGGKSLNQWFKAIGKDLDANKECFMYCYWDYPDHAIHALGTKSWLIHLMIKRINRKLKAFQKKHQDTKILVIADHSLMDIKTINVNDYPDFKATLKHRFYNEGRAAIFEVKDGQKDNFVKLFNQYFGEYYDLLTSEEALKNNLFGEGKPHPYTLETIGDYVAVAISPMTLVDEETPSKFVMKGHHAGGTKEETEIYLFGL